MRAKSRIPGVGAQRLVGQLSQFRVGSCRSFPSWRRRHWWPRPSHSPGAHFMMLRMRFAGIEAGNGALAHAIIQAIGVTVLDPQPLRCPQRFMLPRWRRPSAPADRPHSTACPIAAVLAFEALDHLERVAVAGRLKIAPAWPTWATESQCKNRDPPAEDDIFSMRIIGCGVRPRRLAMILSTVRFGNNAVTRWPQRMTGVIELAHLGIWQRQRLKILFGDFFRR